MIPSELPFRPGALYDVVLTDGTRCQAFQCFHRSDHVNGTWLRINVLKYGHHEAVEVAEVIGTARHEKQEAA